VHDLQQIVLELPSRVVGDAELPGQLQPRNAALALGEQIDRLEPDGQRQVSAMEDSPGGQRRLVMAAMALVEPACELAVSRVAAVRTDQASRPAILKETLPALFLGDVLLKKGQQR